MNVKLAKLLTLAGGAFCLISIVIFIRILFGRNYFPLYSAFLSLAAGIIIIVLSLAYYTEK